MTVKILVVDDILEEVKDIIEKLRELGYNVMFTQNGDSTVKLLKKEHFSAVILDFLFPGLTGKEIILLIKHDKGLKEIPVFFFVGHNSVPSKLKKEFNLLGAEGVWEKPRETQKLIMEIKKIVPLKGEKHDKC